MARAHLLTWPGIFARTAIVETNSSRSTCSAAQSGDPRRGTNRPSHTSSYFEVHKPTETQERSTSQYANAPLKAHNTSTVGKYSCTRRTMPRIAEPILNTEESVKEGQLHTPCSGWAGFGVIVFVDIFRQIALRSLH